MIKVYDKMQRGYCYALTARTGLDFRSDFTPDLTPQEMLSLGVFEGKYLTDCVKEYPSEWFKEAKLSPEKPDISMNYFGLKSRQSLKHWQQKGWILEPDVRGWFQWYCRYCLGRRIEHIDDIQIKRWKSFKRHKAQVEKNCFIMDLSCRKRQRQALLQWAYDPFM